ARMEEEQERIETQVTNIKQDESELTEQIKKVKTKQHDLNEEIQQYESQLYVTDEQRDEKLESIKDEYYQLMSEQSDVNNDIRFLEHTTQENETKQSRLDSRLLDGYKELKNIQTQSTKTEKQSSIEKKEMKKTESEIASYKK